MPRNPTPAQIEASRRNGARSKGPKQHQPILDALPHTLAANATCFPSEDKDTFNQVLASFIHYFEPQNDMEALCVEEMANATWRQRRLWIHEQHLTAYYTPPDAPGTQSEALAQEKLHNTGRTLLRNWQHETRLRKSHEQALARLTALRRGVCPPPTNPHPDTDFEPETRECHDLTLTIQSHATQLTSLANPSNPTHHFPASTPPSSTPIPPLSAAGKRTALLTNAASLLFVLSTAFALAAGVNYGIRSDQLGAPMNRRSFVTAAPLAAAAAPLASSQTPNLGRSKMKITSVKIVKTRPRLPVTPFKPTPGAWSTQEVEVANPMSIYPKYKATRSLFNPDNGKLDDFTVEIATDRGVKGYGNGGRAGNYIIQEHLTKLLLGEDPFDVEKLWDIMWRSTMSYGRMGVTMHAISGVDVALWDIIGKALDMPVYKLLGGQTKDRIPTYCTGNDIEQHVEFGFKRLKLAIPHGPADGLEGMRKNADLVKRARAALGRDGDIMLDCWMAWTERYTLEMAEMLEPYRVYWMEEVLQPHDYAGFGRLRQKIKSTRIVTGEHEYGRYGFRQLLEHQSAEIWQPDAQWCGGLTELRKIASLAAAYDIPVIPHGGGLTPESVHFSMATVNAPWCEMFMPPPGGPKDYYKKFEDDYRLTRGPEGIYMQPHDKPGFGWDPA